MVQHLTKEATVHAPGISLVVRVPKCFSWWIHFLSSALTRNNTKVPLNFFLFSKKQGQNYDPPQGKQPAVSPSWTFKTAQFLGQECCFSPWMTRLGVKLWYRCIRRVSKFVASLKQPWKYVDWEKHCVHLGGTSLRCKKLQLSWEPLIVGPSCGSSHVQGCREESSSSAIWKQNSISCFLLPKIGKKWRSARAKY